MPLSTFKEIFRVKSSIRRKIIRAFALLILFGGMIWLLNDYRHYLFYKKIQIIDQKNSLLNTVLEARRYEKNFFLSADPGNLHEALRYIRQAEAKLHQIIDQYGRFTLNRNLNEKVRQLENYAGAIRKLISLYQTQSQTDFTSFPASEAVREEVIRLGRSITEDMESMVNQERMSLDRLINDSRIHLLLLSVAVMTLCIAVALFLIFNVNRPLKAIESAIHKIAQGDYSHISLECNSDEFDSLVGSLNKMISELNRRNEQLVQSEKMASLGTLTSGVAHELNNPLNNISTSLQIVMEEWEEDNLEFKRELLAETEKQIERARDIVKSLLEFSRKTPFSARKVQFKNVVEKTVTLIKGEIPTNVNLVVDVPETIETVLDPRRIQQVLINLVLNGIQAMPEGGELKISAYRHNENFFAFQVEDSGTGIPEAYLSKIFDPFFTTKEVGKGSGLGLAVTHGIVENHGGHIEVESTPGQGSIFSVVLPLTPKIPDGHVTDSP